MKTMKLVFAVIGLMLLFGCIGGEQPNPTQNESKNITPPVKIIVGEQQNQTGTKNLTEETPSENQTKGADYFYNPDQIFGIFFMDIAENGSQTDAILVKKGDLDILIDAGSKEKGGKVVDFLHAHGVDDIEVLISTSADPQRYGGIEAVAENFGIEEFWWSGDGSNSEYVKIVEQMGEKARIVKDGFSTNLNGMKFDLINPPQKPFGDFNNDAIVTRITDRNFSILLTSGIQTGAQGLLTNQKANQIKNQIITAPYYGVGAGTSNIGIFLITAKPQVMIITGSSDDSAKNGGSREPYKKLMKQYGIKWYETYVNGTIRVSSDGMTYDIQSLGKGQ